LGVGVGLGVGLGVAVAVGAGVGVAVGASVGASVDVAVEVKLTALCTVAVSVGVALTWFAPLDAVDTVTAAKIQEKRIRNTKNIPHPIANFPPGGCLRNQGPNR
jgi:hypothetical protein